MIVLVTGDNGMIGTHLVKGLLDAGHIVIGVDKTGDDSCHGNYFHYKVDIAEKEQLVAIDNLRKVDRFIHLAALAHTSGEHDLCWQHYKHINVDCAKNVFDVAGDRPLLFISTVDVFGFYDGREPVSDVTQLKPVSYYGKSKAMAEEECKKMKHYTIYRFSPVYTDSLKRDIQKRYYLKYPKIAYQIGRGSAYEVLNVNRAVDAMVSWCIHDTNNDIRVIKDDNLLWTQDCIKKEKSLGRAKIVLHFPRWMVNIGYDILKRIFGENEKIYLLNKAVYPLRSK